MDVHDSKSDKNKGNKSLALVAGLLILLLVIAVIINFCR